MVKNLNVVLSDISHGKLVRIKEAHELNNLIEAIEYAITVTCDKEGL